jgi:hypothetical protein
MTKVTNRPFEPSTSAQLVTVINVVINVVINRPVNKLGIPHGTLVSRLFCSKLNQPFKRRGLEGLQPICFNPTVCRCHLDAGLSDLTGVRDTQVLKY